MKIIFISAYAMCFFAPFSAPATPRTLPFSYPYETLPEGGTEIEVTTDATPLRVPADANNAASGNLWEPGMVLQTELEYGLDDRFELAFYQAFKSDPQPGGQGAFSLDGLKWRLRTRLAEAGQWPLDVGLYFELETMHDELAFEWKLNLQRRLGRARILSNLWFEESYERPYDTVAHGRSAHFIIDPTLGLSYEVTPRFQPGFEFWARGELKATGATAIDRANSRVHYFIGPTTHVNLGRLWWTLGVYFNANSVHTPELGAAYGPVWLRSMLGLDL